jgi:hypothetical protein
MWGVWAAVVLAIWGASSASGAHWTLRIGLAPAALELSATSGAARVTFKI